jgi:hypothetical protein
VHVNHGYVPSSNPAGKKNTIGKKNEKRMKPGREEKPTTKRGVDNSQGVPAYLRTLLNFRYTACVYPSGKIQQICATLIVSNGAEKKREKSHEKKNGKRFKAGREEKRPTIKLGLSWWTDQHICIKTDHDARAV